MEIVKEVEYLKLFLKNVEEERDEKMKEIENLKNRLYFEELDRDGLKEFSERFEEVKG